MCPDTNCRNGEDWIEMYQDKVHPNAPILRQKLRDDREIVMESLAEEQWHTIEASCLLDPRHKA